jgi:hypothetical protein
VNGQNKITTKISVAISGILRGIQAALHKDKKTKDIIHTCKYA